MEVKIQIMSRRMPLCVLCKRYHRFEDGYIDEAGIRHNFCDAYPDGEGIPEAVYRVGHFKPKPGDNGLQFEECEDISTVKIAITCRSSSYGQSRN